MDVQTTKQAISSLVEDCPNLQELFTGYTMFVTISPNPRTKHSIQRRNPETRKMVTCQMAYGMLPQRVQYAYCMKVLKECYLTHCIDPIVVGCAELNTDGNVHFHFLLKDPDIKNDVMLQVFRRSILNCPTVLKNFKGKDYMNNIVNLTKTKEDIVKYMDKDHDDIKEVFDNYYLLNK